MLSCLCVQGWGGSERCSRDGHDIQARAVLEITSADIEVFHRGRGKVAKHFGGKGLRSWKKCFSTTEPHI